jgi:plasmid replication initiation protein
MARKNNKRQTVNYENSIKKSNVLSMAKISQGLSLNQMQLLAYAIFCTQQDGKTEFHKSEFENKFSIDYKTVHAKEDALKLSRLQFSVEDLENDFFEYWNIFQGIRYKQGLFMFIWSEEIIPHILELKEKYILTDLSITSNFKSSFSWTLYDYLKAHYGYWHKPISKEGMIRLFGVEASKSYQTNSSLFKRKVLDVAIGEINQYTELDVHYKEEKKGRAIVGFDLIWSNGTISAHATEKQIRELKAILNIIFEDMFKFVNINHAGNREQAIHIVRETEKMKEYIETPICITKEKADTLIQQAAWNLRELNRFLEEDGKPHLPFYDWLNG